MKIEKRCQNEDPADDVYIFLGKPPKKFGIAWIEDGDKIINFKSLVEFNQYQNRS